MQPTEVGLLIRRLREERDPRMPQEELAFRLGFSQSRVSKIERGVTQRPKKEVLRAIARALGVDPDPLFIAADYTPDSVVQITGTSAGGSRSSGRLTVQRPREYYEQLATQALEELAPDDWADIEAMLEERRRKKRLLEG